MRKYIERGEPTYRRFLILGAFEPIEAYAQLWAEHILDKLDSPSLWTLKKSEHRTQIANKHIELTTRRRFGRFATFTIGLFRDGFHVNVSGDIDFMPSSELNKFRIDVFGEPNRSGGWTQEIAKVAPMANAIVKDVTKFLKDKDNI